MRRRPRARLRAHAAALLLALALVLTAAGPAAALEPLEQLAETDEVAAGTLEETLHKKMETALGILILMGSGAIM